MTKSLREPKAKGVRPFMAWAVFMPDGEMLNFSKDKGEALGWMLHGDELVEVEIRPVAGGGKR